jgi:hypothetical protein
VDLQHFVSLADVEENVLNITPKITTQLKKVYNSFASLFKGVTNLAVESAKYTALNKRKRRSSDDSEAFPFEAPETCSLTDTELDQITGLIQKFGTVDKEFCKKLPASTSRKITASPLKPNNSTTKSVNSPIKSASNWSKLASSVRSNSTVNSTQLAASPTKSGVNSTAVVSPIKSVTNTTKPIASSTKSAVNSTKLAASPKKSTTTTTTKLDTSSTKPVNNSTKSIVGSKNSMNNSTQIAANPININSTISSEVRRKRSLSAGGCDQLIESIKLSTNNLKSAFCDLSSTNRGTDNLLYEERKTAYETEISQLKEKLDNKDLHVEQKYKVKIDKLKTDFQKVERNMRDTLLKLENEQYSHMKTNAELVLQFMKNGEIQKALDKFKILELRNNTMRIVSLALIKENVPIENIIKFTEGLGEVDSLIYGTLHLFYELEKKQSLYEAKIISLLQNAIDKVIQRMVELDEKSGAASSKKIDRYAIDHLIRTRNKLDFLKIYAFKT